MASVHALQSGVWEVQSQATVFTHVGILIYVCVRVSTYGYTGMYTYGYACLYVCVYIGIESGMEGYPLGCYMHYCGGGSTKKTKEVKIALKPLIFQPPISNCLYNIWSKINFTMLKKWVPDFVPFHSPPQFWFLLVYRWPVFFLLEA